MKFLKTYEENINEPKVGDYVIFQDNNTIDKFKEISSNFNYFLSKNIGKIVQKNSDLHAYKIKYDNEPSIDVLEYAFYGKYDRTIIDIPNIKIFQTKYTNITSAKRNDIIYFAPTKEELEIKVNSNKYNL